MRCFGDVFLENLPGTGSSFPRAGSDMLFPPHLRSLPTDPPRAGASGPYNPEEAVSKLLASQVRQQRGACLPAACKQGAVSPRWFLCKPLAGDISTVRKVVPGCSGHCPVVPAHPYSGDVLLILHPLTGRNRSRSGVSGPEHRCCLLCRERALL